MSKKIRIINTDPAQQASSSLPLPHQQPSKLQFLHVFQTTKLTPPTNSIIKMVVTLTEGAPTSIRVFHSGRGGAGNYHTVPKNLPNPPTSILAPSMTNTSTSSNTKFYAGRGGAGNARTHSERAVFSFDEELERDRMLHEHHAPVYSVGRGGAGNMVAADNIATRSFYNDTPRTSTSTDRDSLRSGHSASGLAGRMSRVISRVRSSGSN